MTVLNGNWDSAGLRLRARAACVLASACGLYHGALSAAESAASFPTKPVRLIVAQGIGSSVDTISRILGTQLSEVWGRQVITDNRGGAGGTIGAEIASRAAPDGYTLLISSTAMQVISPQVYKKLTYHPTQDFAQVSMLAMTQNVLVAHPNFPVKSVKELLAYAKANPGKINMANAGSGFQSHLAAVLFTHLAAIDVHHVPYKGGTSLLAVIAGESNISIAPAPALMTHVRSGRLRALASGGEKRSPLTPELPTVSESGVPGFVSTGWVGLMAPKNVSRPLFDRIYSTVIQVMSHAATRDLLARQGADPITSTPAEMLSFINAEYGRFTQAIKLANLTLQ